MNPELESLLNIQELDKRVANLEEELQIIEKKEAKILEVINIKQGQLDETKSEKEEILKDKAFKEELLADTLENLKKLEVKINNVNTEKQMQAVNAEMDTAKTNKNILEEKIMSLEEEIELKDKDIKELEDRYAQLQKTLQEHKEKFDKRRAQINKEIEQIKNEKETLINEIDYQLLDKYEKLNKWTKGTSIVPVKKGACYGCFMKLTPQTVANLEETDDIILCPNCGRILYIDENSEND